MPAGVIALLFPLNARCAEVVWLSPPETSEQVALAAAAGAQGPPLTPLDLRAAATRWTEQDERALRALSAALDTARSYEELLDGELLVLRDLQQPTANITALRDDADRNVLYTALLYQGFAVQRYFGDEFANDEAAAPHRSVVIGQPIERPWLDAAALEPERAATPYEIGESPQRIAYEERRQRLSSLAPATLTPVDWPAEASISVDGRRVVLELTGNLKVRPGRHLVHAEIDGDIVERWQVDVAPASDTQLMPRIDDTTWTRFLDDPESTPLSAPLTALITALGGEIWLAVPKGPVWSVTEGGVRRLSPAELRPSSTARLAPWLGRLSLGAMSGWLSSGDFYAQDPSRVPHTVASVNAPVFGGWAEAMFSAGPVLFGCGIDGFLPTGRYHIALSGEDRFRLRPAPYLAAGAGPVDLAAAWLFPYHPAAGVHLTQPIGPRAPFGRLVLRSTAFAGWPLAQSRSDGSRWEGHPLYTLAAGVGLGW